MPRTDALLSYAEVAKLTGLAPVTLRKYRQLGYLPEPDELPVPDRPRWRASTIRQWIKDRPGRGSPGVPRGPRSSSRRQVTRTG